MKFRSFPLAVTFALTASALPLLAQQPDLSSLITMPEAGAGVSPLQQSDDYTKTQAQAHAESKKAFSVTASVREQYDDNIYTSHDNKVSDYTTIAEPSFLFNYPMTDTLLSARYTFDATAYAKRDKTFDTAHDLTMRVNQTFSSRFNLDARDRVHYSNQPEIDSGSVVNRVAGTYFNNTFSLQGTTQWTPKLSTVTSYTNDYFTYDDPTVAATDNRDSHTLQHDFRYTLTPTVTLVNGGSINALFYDHKVTSTVFGTLTSRNWTSFTGYTGADWTALPELTLGVRGGGVYTTYDANLKDSLAPYASFFTTWQAGAKSTLDFNYMHSVSPTDLSSYSSATSDSVSLTGTYKFTPKLTGRLQGSYTMNTSTSSTAITAGAGTYHENTLGVTTGLGYDFTQYLNLNVGYSLTNVGSDAISSSYNRNQVSLGLTASF